jgi:hypothetical protein
MADRQRQRQRNPTRRDAPGGVPPEALVDDRLPGADVAESGAEEAERIRDPVRRERGGNGKSRA